MPRDYSTRMDEKRRNPAPKLLWHAETAPGMYHGLASVMGRGVDWPSGPHEHREMAHRGIADGFNAIGLFQWGQYLITLAMEDTDGSLETNALVVRMIRKGNRPRPPADSVMKRGIPIEKMEQRLRKEYVKELDLLAKTRWDEWSDGREGPEFWRLFGDSVADSLETIQKHQAKRTGRGRGPLSADDLATTLAAYKEAIRIKPPMGLRTFMAKKLGITQDAVSKRIRRLRDEGLIEETPAGKRKRRGGK